jgi:hypothetical protein
MQSANHLDSGDVEQGLAFLGKRNVSLATTTTDQAYTLFMQPLTYWKRA